MARSLYEVDQQRLSTRLQAERLLDDLNMHCNSISISSGGIATMPLPIVEADIQTTKIALEQAQVSTVLLSEVFAF